MAKEDATMTDAEAKPEKGADDLKQSKDAKAKGKGKAEDTTADLSEEDQAIKANLEMLVERAHDSDTGIQANALEVRPAPRTYLCVSVGATCISSPLLHTVSCRTATPLACLGPCCLTGTLRLLS